MGGDPDLKRLDQTSSAFYLSAGPELKLKRALEHLGELVSAVKLFAEENALGFRVEEDPNTGEQVAIAMIRDQPPPAVGLILSDCIHNMRQALDHVAYTLAALISGEEPPPNERSASFPLHKSSGGFGDHIARQVGDPEKMPAGLVQARKDLQPYKGGVGKQLGILQELDNAAKHRRLPVCVGVIEHEDIGVEGDIIVKSTEAGPLKRGEQEIGRFEAPESEVEVWISGKFRVTAIFEDDSPAGPVEITQYVEETRHMLRHEVFAKLTPFFRGASNPGSKEGFAEVDLKASSSDD